MSDPTRHSLRIVVQHVQAPGRAFYRLVAYGGPAYRPIEFPSLDSLSKALTSIFPDLDSSTLSLRNNAPGTCIVFTRDADLDGQQLDRLGLRI